MSVKPKIKPPTPKKRVSVSFSVVMAPDQEFTNMSAEGKVLVNIPVATITAIKNDDKYVLNLTQGWIQQLEDPIFQTAMSRKPQILDQMFSGGHEIQLEIKNSLMTCSIQMDLFTATFVLEREKLDDNAMFRRVSDLQAEMAKRARHVLIERHRTRTQIAELKQQVRDVQTVNEDLRADMIKLSQRMLELEAEAKAQPKHSAFYLVQGKHYSPHNQLHEAPVDMRMYWGPDPDNQWFDPTFCPQNHVHHQLRDHLAFHLVGSPVGRRWCVTMKCEDPRAAKEYQFHATKLSSMEFEVVLVLGNGGLTQPKKFIH